MRMANHTNNWTSTRVRQVFIDYFVKKHDHVFFKTSPVIPFEDPTILFTNAGMNQFKPLFLGLSTANSPLHGLKRAVNSQKCIRAGGKHNDLDDVGKDTYHHTFFEMLGSWSFGDYFKREIALMAWDLLTNIYKLPKDRLYVTYFEGDAAQGLEPDLEIKKIWEDIGVPEKNVITGGVKDNFWEMGEVGPCGPCSEIHYDRIGGRDASHLVNKDDPDVLEIWNLVFIQFDRSIDGVLTPLPDKHVDTGMGLERITSILQKKNSNYDTDIFTPIFDTIHKLSNVRKYSGKVGKEDTDGIDTSYRVIADHIRTLCFSIADGGTPSNEGRGYVMRRIIRRGVRFATKCLKMKDVALFPHLVDTVVENLGDFFPELKENIGRIKEILEREELFFKKTLYKGERIFGKYIEKQTQLGNRVIPSSQLWKMYDTYGFPLDLTLIMAEEAGMEVDMSEFAKIQAEASEISRQSREKFEKSPITLSVQAIMKLKADNINPTDDSYKYAQDDISSKILAIYDGMKFHDSFSQNDTHVGIVLDNTPFYSESGGQIYDTGFIECNDDVNMEVTDVQCFGQYVLHIVVIKSGKIAVGDEVSTILNWERRYSIMKNHTGTHVLNFGLREVLGNRVDQKGSLVAPEKLRFDFSHDRAVEEKQLLEIENICLEILKKDLPVYSSALPLDMSTKINGVRAVFGETYPDPVLVVSIGAHPDEIAKDPENPKWRELSIELCGGTHVTSTAHIQHFVLTDECGIAKGIRRITALTGSCAELCKIQGKVMSDKINRLKYIEYKDLASAIKEVSKELEESKIPLLLKHDLKRKFSDIKKLFIQKDNINKSDEVNEAIGIVKDHFSKENSKYLVKLLPYKNNLKALNKCIQYVRTLDNKACLLAVICDDPVSVKFQCYSPDNFFTDKKNAEDWANCFKAPIDGKFGGWEKTLSGVGKHVEGIDKALALAGEFAKLHL